MCGRVAVGLRVDESDDSTDRSAIYHTNTVGALGCNAFATTVEKLVQPV